MNSGATGLCESGRNVKIIPALTEIKFRASSGRISVYRRKSCTTGEAQGIPKHKILESLVEEWLAGVLMQNVLE